MKVGAGVLGRRHGLVLVALILLVACGAPSAPATPMWVPVPTSEPTALPAPTASPAPVVTAVPSPTSAPPAPTVASTILAVPTLAPTATIAPTPTPRPVAGLPKRLRVPRLRIDALVEYVGLDRDGAMDVPKGYDTVGWYDLGARPGELGSAVMAGHLDSKTGPAIFWRLRDLKPGDDVFVISADGKERRFRVNETVIYRFDQAPLERIFAAPDGIGLNLITCGGAFDRRTQNYDQRVVVYTTLAT